MYNDPLPIAFLCWRASDQSAKFETLMVRGGEGRKMKNEITVPLKIKLGWNNILIRDET